MPSNRTEAGARRTMELIGKDLKQLAPGAKVEVECGACAG